MRKDIAEEHMNCQLEIRWKLFKGQVIPTAGLFCSEHNVFLDWLNPDIAYQLIDVDGIQVGSWQEKIKKNKEKKPKVLTSSPLPKPKQTLRQRKSKKIRLKEKNNEYKKRFGIAI